MATTTTTTITLQTLTIATSLVTAGGIAALSLFDIPQLQSQPASRSLPTVRWLFSRGSHIFPTAAILSSAGFASLAYRSLPTAQRTLLNIFRTTNGIRFNGYVVAGLLAASIGPFTTWVMIPTNFRLIKMNEELGGARSMASAKIANRAGSRSAEDSVNGKGEAPQFTDLSGPQERTPKDSTAAQDEEVKELLEKFKVMNAMRAVLVAAGGIIGLVTALS